LGNAVALLVTVASGDSVSRGVDAEGIFCNASIVADCGGVFSPRILFCGLLAEGRITGVKLDDIGVGELIAD
jgi:hypothetical protein